jgi:hypothetical protein
VNLPDDGRPSTVSGAIINLFSKRNRVADATPSVPMKKQGGIVPFFARTFTKSRIAPSSPSLGQKAVEETSSRMAALAAVPDSESQVAITLTDVDSEDDAEGASESTTVSSEQIGSNMPAPTSDSARGDLEQGGPANAPTRTPRQTDVAIPSGQGQTCRQTALPPQLELLLHLNQTAAGDFDPEVKSIGDMMGCDD